MFIEQVQRPTKEELSKSIASLLGIPAPAVSKGGSVDSGFLDEIHSERTGRRTGGADTYRKTELLLEELGLIYDPWWDTSEAQGPTGGGTVTARAFSRIRTALTGIPRAFLLGPRMAMDKGQISFDSTPSGNALADAGPGAMLLFTQEENGAINIVGSGVVTEIASGWRAPWTVVWRHQRLGTPLTIRKRDLRGRSFIEISSSSYESVTSTVAEPDVCNVALEEDRALVKRLVSSYPADEVRINRITIPATGDPDSPTTELEEPAYVEASVSDDVTALTSTSGTPAFRQPNDRRLAQMVEERAIALASRALDADGWLLERDCQKDGIGYDLRFRRGGRNLHVEVKGIQSANLAFNLTPKEWWRALADPDWVLLAVTSALSPTSPKVHVLTGAQVRSAKRSVLSYRIVIPRDQ